MTHDPATPGRELFPEYASLAGWYADEVRGLSEAQIDRRLPEKSWGAWSIREQVSHTAWIPYLFFLNLWREALFGETFPRDPSLLDAGGADRMMNPKRFHEMADLLAALEDGCSLAWEVLGRETAGSLREKVLPRRVPRDRVWANGERVIDYFEGLVLPAHAEGLWRDEADPELFHQSLECTFRHILWEAYVHLRTIQKFKEAEGLPPSFPVPEVGYVGRLTWE